MKNELKPYEEYKSTAYDWLPVVPSHWNGLSMRSITTLSDVRNRERNDLELLSVYREYGVIKKASRSDNHNVESLDLSNYKYVNTGYLVMNKMKMWQGSLGVSKYEGIVSPAYIVCKVKEEIESKYLHYLLRSATFKTHYNRISYGVRVGQWDMRYDDFKSLKVYLPTIAEQNQIVCFLDSKLAKIDKLLKAKKKLIELLKEQKQAIINQAVTKGLDPNAKMKPSGIEWIGDIPIEWEIVPLKRVVKTVKTGSTPEGANEKFYETNGFDWFTPSDFNDELFLTSATRQLSELGIEKVKVFPANTVLMIGIGGTMGKVSISKNECSCNQQINAIICDEKVCESYLAYYLRAKKQYIFDTAKYTTLPILNQEETKSIPFISQSLSEQQKIISFIEVKTKSIDKTINTIKTEIELITEYRTGLVSEVVTGKIDVRDIAVEAALITEDVLFNEEDDIENEDFPESEE